MEFGDNYVGGEEKSADAVHVHDLPQLYTKPPAQALLDTLNNLKETTNSFDADSAGCAEQWASVRVDPSSVPRYLTTVVSSSLQWLDDADREVIWELASLRMSERAGRSAAPSMTREFKIDDRLTLKLHEPSLTEDGIGLKTWTSSLLLSRRLESLSHHVPNDAPRILELGSGTGLVGLSAVYMWQDLLSEVTLTDLHEILPNLRNNVELNAHSLSSFGHKDIEINTRVLDWADTSDLPKHADERYALIVAADPIYSEDHPQLLVGAIQRWIAHKSSSRFILELPIRQGYDGERADLRRRLECFMQVMEDGEEIGYDDWQGADGRYSEVRCWWSVWCLRDT